MQKCDETSVGRGRYVCREEVDVRTDLSTQSFDSTQTRREQMMRKSDQYLERLLGS